MRILPFVSLFLLLLLPGAQMAVAQSGDAGLSAEFDRICSEKFPADGPGGAVLVARGDQIIYHKAFGLDDLENKKPLRPGMVFRIGSVTKQFTAIAILQLVGQGKISLQDEITRFIPDYPVQGRKITIEQLLHHTSGIKSYTDMEEWTAEMHKKDFTPAALIDFFKNQPVDFEPGTQYKYNNSGYVLLGYIIEKVSGMSYADYLAKKVFKRAGLSNTSCENKLRPVPNWANGFSKAGDGYKPAPPLSMTQPYAAGALVSTVEDLYRWTRAVHAGKLVPADLLPKAHTPHILPDGTNTHYGYGWIMGNLLGSPTIEHDGGIHGFLSSLLYLPKEGICVAVLTNCDCNPPGELAAELAALAAGHSLTPEAIPLDAGALESYAGVYENAQKVRRVIRVTDGELVSQRTGGLTSALIPVDPDRFRFKSSLATVIFLRDEKTGEVNAISLDTRMVVGERWEKTGEAVPEAPKEITLTEDQLERLVGEYELAPGFSITVTRNGARLYGQATGQSEFELFATSGYRFFLKVVAAEIEFFPDENGTVNKLVLYQNGREIPGSKIK